MSDKLPEDADKTGGRVIVLLIVLVASPFWLGFLVKLFGGNQ